MRSLYSQQQTHGLRLPDTTCLFLQHPPPHPSLCALTKPSVSRSICLQTRAPREQYQELKQTSQTCPPTLSSESLQTVCLTGSSFYGRLPVCPSSHLSSCLTSSLPPLSHETMRSLDRRGSQVLVWTSWISGKQSPDRELLANSKTDPNTSRLQCHWKQKLIEEGLLIGWI